MLLSLSVEELRKDVSELYRQGFIVIFCRKLKIETQPFKSRCCRERRCYMASDKKKELIVRSSAAEYLTFVASTGNNDASFEMRYEDESIWLTQKMMAELYGVDVRTINEHIKKIYSDGELVKNLTIRKFRIVQNEGSRQVNREVMHYNLQLIIAVGFKVNNQRAVQLRKWAGQIVEVASLISGGYLNEQKSVVSGGNHFVMPEYLNSDSFRFLESCYISEIKT